MLVASTSGISGIIAPDGRVLARSAQFTPAAQVARVPLRTSRTPADRLGAAPEWALAFLGCAAAAVARGDEEAPPALREWAVKLEAKPKYVVSSTRTDFPWANSHHLAGDLREGVQQLKDATPAGVLLGSGKLATELDRLDLIDEYQLLVHPRIAGHGPTLYQDGLPGTRRLELLSAQPLRDGAVAMHYRSAR